jgi:hypothetical protein
LHKCRLFLWLRVSQCYKFITEMEEGESSAKGVKLASILLILMAVPFFLFTCLLILVIVISPFVLVTSDSKDDFYATYLVCFALMLFSFFIAYGLITLSTIIKANYFASNDRKTPKSHLYDFIGILFGLIGIVLINGSVLAFTAAGFLGMAIRKYWISDGILFSIATLLTGIFVLITKKYLLRAAWWRK